MWRRRQRVEGEGVWEERYTDRQTNVSAFRLWLCIRFLDCSSPENPVWGPESGIRQPAPPPSLQPQLIPRKPEAGPRLLHRLSKREANGSKRVTEIKKNMKRKRHSVFCVYWFHCVHPKELTFSFVVATDGPERQKKRGRKFKADSVIYLREGALLKDRTSLGFLNRYLSTIYNAVHRKK